MSAVATTTQAEVARAVREVADPEIPVLTIDDLGLVRELDVDEDTGVVQVTITPTYSGCPAMEVIRRSVEEAIASRGYRAAVATRLSPAWTTDWMSARGREALRRFGIAPPGERAAGQASRPVPVGLSRRQVACPTCGSTATEELSRFGSTACKALRRCLECREPFEEFKPI